ncbi:hypothetical protein JCM3775_002649 [Rhodotorula graminis]|uniref:CHY-type domain-containing protein n=1 Tax=Rhodotorula graminis (strain WP1) TaxID=578459 RepID=A0A0P9EUS2_RHOGW|nr:uncharacterized protein RHOBADRAFT_65544 [Rhodotorula graminis WP1]KPV72887.1 hypothetical protein RHOBADRAFT_65544 [Rhodotorula graminis WP1]
MCKHILNAQASIRAPCCKRWFDCAECHAEVSDHPLARMTEMAFLCKKCRKAFRKDMGQYEDSDEYCPHCDNHYVIEAKTANAMLTVESEDVRVDNRAIKDDRVKEGKIDTSELDDWLTQLDGAPGPAPEDAQ